MIVVHKKLKGLIPYRLIWFPTDAALQALANRMPSSHIARVECADRHIIDARTLVEHHLSLTFCLNLQRPLGDIFGGFNATARNLVRRGEKLAGRITVRRYSGEAQNGSLVDEFVGLFNDLARQKPEALFPISRELVDSYFPHAELFLLDIDDKLICGHICLRDPGGRIRLLYSASRRLETESSQLVGLLNVYLHWYEIQTYRDAGFATYDFGGVSPVDSPGINRFKRQFGGELVKQHSYLMAGLPLSWRLAFMLFAKLTARGRRRYAVERAGDKWKNMSLEEIHQFLQV